MTIKASFEKYFIIVIICLYNFNAKRKKTANSLYTLEFKVKASAPNALLSRETQKPKSAICEKTHQIVRTTSFHNAYSTLKLFKWPIL